MSEHGILFNELMIKAILAGRKTMTRRLVKFPVIDRQGLGIEIAGCEINSCILQGLDICPFGKIGDRLWVREAFACADWYQDHWEQAKQNNNACARMNIVYKADGEPNGDPNAMKDWRWTPSIHMPRFASRILLEITELRVERVKSISEEDAKREGIFHKDYGLQCYHVSNGPKDVGTCPSMAGHEQKPGWSWYDTTSPNECHSTWYGAAAGLFCKTFSPEVWESNPWVWVIGFQLIQTKRGEMK